MSTRGIYNSVSGAFNNRTVAAVEHPQASKNPMPLQKAPFKRLTLALMVSSLAACSDSNEAPDSAAGSGTDTPAVVTAQNNGVQQPVAVVVAQNDIVTVADAASSTQVADESPVEIIEVPLPHVTENESGSSNDSAANGDGSTPTDSDAVEDPPPSVPFDFFGKGLEVDNESAVAGGPPTTPKNLRAELISNDWVQLNWAPSNDDVAVGSYKIYRGDGVVYTVSAADQDFHLQRYWQTTSFIDCNFTHVRDCSNQGTTPAVGSNHTYQVSAIDIQGNESARSNLLEVKLHEARGATIEKFSDPYLDANDDFMFVRDLSKTENFMDQFELAFADEFNGAQIDSAKWTTSLTWRQEDQNIINGEMQYFVDIQSDPDFGYNPFIMTGETLKISAIKTPPELSEKALGQPFLSGALSSHETRSGQVDDNGILINDKFGTTYGYVEGRIKVGTVPGMLTSFYLFRRWEGEQAPEIDIIEYLGENPFGAEKAFQTYHYKDVTYTNIQSSPTMSYPRESGSFGDLHDLNGFHTYGVLWEPNLVIWYVDGEEVQRMTGPQVARQSMNIILYLVTGSAWAQRPADNAPYPLEIEIDYVRAFKRKPWNG